MHQFLQLELTSKSRINEFGHQVYWIRITHFPVRSLSFKYLPFNYFPKRILPSPKRFFSNIFNINEIWTKVYLSTINPPEQRSVVWFFRDNWGRYLGFQMVIGYTGDLRVIHIKLPSTGTRRFHECEMRTCIWILD